MKKLLLILLCVGWWAGAEAQVFEPGDGPRRVRTDGALGFGAAELTWWLSDKVFKNDRLAVGVTGNGVCLIVKSEE